MFGQRFWSYNVDVTCKCGLKLVITPPPIGSVQYCDEHVCLSVCVFGCLSIHDHISGTIRPIFTVLLWRRSDMLHTSGFMDDVIFAHKLRLLDVAAKLR